MPNVYVDAELFRRDPLSFLVKRGETATDLLVLLRVGPDPVYLLTDPDYAKPFLNISEDLLDKGSMTRSVHDLVGDNVVTLSGPLQRLRRAAWHSVVGANYGGTPCATAGDGGTCGSGRVGKSPQV